MKEKEFVLYLEKQKDLVKSKLAKVTQKNLLRNEKINAIDKIVEQPKAIFFQALKLSTLCTKNSGKREPWWNKKCQFAAQKFKQKNRYCDLNRATGITDLQA